AARARPAAGHSGSERGRGQGRGRLRAAFSSGAPVPGSGCGHRLGNPCIGRARRVYGRATGLAAGTVPGNLVASGVLSRWNPKRWVHRRHRDANGTAGVEPRRPGPQENPRARGMIMVDPMALAGMIFTLILVVLIGGIIVITPLTRR